MRDEYQQDKQTMIAQYLCASLLILDRVICLLRIRCTTFVMTNIVREQIIISAIEINLDIAKCHYSISSI